MFQVNKALHSFTSSNRYLQPLSRTEAKDFQFVRFLSSIKFAFSGPNTDDMFHKHVCYKLKSEQQASNQVALGVENHFEILLNDKDRSKNL